MKKEILIVIILGIVIGGIIAYGIYIAQNALKTQEAANPLHLEEKPASATEEGSNHFLTLISPEPNSISSEPEITISGKTSSLAIITIFTAENEYLLSADESGDFSAEIVLEGGANEIQVSAFNTQGGGEKAEATLTLVYSTAEI